MDLRDDRLERISGGNVVSKQSGLRAISNALAEIVGGKLSGLYLDDRVGWIHEGD